VSLEAFSALAVLGIAAVFEFRHRKVKARHEIALAGLRRAGCGLGARGLRKKAGG
jgi:hypothetical protein